MKKRTLLFTLIAGMGYLVFSSNLVGPALSTGGNRSGAKSSIANCSAGGCHGSATGVTVTITVDSGTSSTVATHYRASQLYTIKIHGTGTTNTKYGFQFASVTGIGTSQLQAGTPGGLPASVATHTLSGLSFVEHTSALTTSTAGVFDVSFTWTAPATLTAGAVTFYCTLNSVNGDGGAGSGDFSGNTSLVLPAITALSVPSVANDAAIKAFPNPVSNSLNLQTENTGTYAVRVYDLSGRTFISEQVTINGAPASINTSNLTPGFYQLVMEKDGDRQVIPIVKN